MRWFSQWFSQCPSPAPRRLRQRQRQFETLESRKVFASDVLPVLMVVADQQDFYYREYNETRLGLEGQGLDVVVAATTTDTTYPHAHSGQLDQSGAVTPDLALASVNPDDYSAIVFVGGWGASMYQYAFNDPNGDGITDNYYAEGRYNGDDNLNDGQIAAQKIIVNQLINDFLADDKHVAAICHGVTVLAWARVDGVSPLSGKQVAVPHTVSSPNQFYEGVWRTDGYYDGQYQQVLANGGLASPVSGAIGNPNTTADDVVVDGRIITAENFDSSFMFGEVIAQEVLAAQPEVELPPVSLVGDDLVVRGTDGDDTIYLWSGGSPEIVYVWMNGTQSDAIIVGSGAGGGPHVKVFGGQGNDRIFATDLHVAAAIDGEGGHDLITGGWAGDVIDGGEGVDRLWGGPGDDVLRGGSGDDFLFGREGNNVLLGGDCDDYLEGLNGRDILIGGLGSDVQRGGGGEDLLIGGTTDFDDHDAALQDLLAIWTSPQDLGARQALLADESATLRLRLGDTVHDDGADDALVGGLAADWLFWSLGDRLYGNDAEDRITG